MFKRSEKAYTDGRRPLLVLIVLSNPPFPETSVRILLAVASEIFESTIKSDELKIGVQKKKSSARIAWGDLVLSTIHSFFF